MSATWIKRISSVALLAILGACAPLPMISGETHGSGAQTGWTENDMNKINMVLTLTRELLLLAPDVARVSWNNKSVLQDRANDMKRLQALEQAAARYKTDPVLVRDYFQGLIEADRYVQTELHKQWRAQGVPATITLTRTAAQLQAASEDLTPKLLAALAQVLPVLSKPGATAQIQMRALEILPKRSALSEPTRELALAPLLARAAR